MLTPADFTSLAELQARLAAFERHYQQAAAPFQWKFTHSDLAKLMERLAAKPDHRGRSLTPAIRDRNYDPEH